MSRFLFSFCLIFFTSGFVSAAGFETERMKDTYALLPENLQAAIESHAPDKNFRISTDDIIQGSQVKVCYNSINQICHLGFGLFDDSVAADGYAEAYYFIENSLLDYVLAGQASSVLKLSQKRATSFFLNYKPVTNDIKEMISGIVKSKKISLNMVDYQFIASGTTYRGDKFSMKFPADINLLKDMDKGQLEDELLLKMKTFASSGNIILPEQDYRGDQRTLNGLYIQKGTYFETDDFRSDIYLSKKNNDEYLPVYSGKYPVESFSNLFICNLPSSIDVKLTTILYGNKSDKSTLKLKKMQAFLSENNITFFGLQSNEDQLMKATIVYFNPTYRYIHMLVVEAGKLALFGNGDKTINAGLYLFIPQANFIKEVIYE